MTELLTPMRYAQVVYLTAPAARSVVTRAVSSLPPGDQARMAVRDLPETAFTPEPAQAAGGQERASVDPRLVAITVALAQRPPGPQLLAAAYPCS